MFRVFLRALELDDYRVSIEWRRDEEIWRQLVGRRYFVSEEYERGWVERAVAGSPTELRLAVCLRQGEKYIGNVYLSRIDYFNRQAESAILVGERACWGSGYGTEALLLLLRHAFQDLGMERIEARALVTNLASTRLHERCGFRTEGTLRRAAFKEGRLCDLRLMACLREDFMAAWQRAVPPSGADPA